MNEAPEKPRVMIGHGPVASEVCKALGIDPRTCVGLEFRMHVGEVVAVTVERRVFEHEAKAFALVLERFNLVPQDDGQQDITSVADAAVHKAIRGQP